MNIVERSFAQRGKEVHLQELADVAAVRSPPLGGSQAVAAQLGELASMEALPQFRALEDAGWCFVPRQEASDGAKVYLKSGGRVVLGTNRLTVRIAGQRSAEEAEQLLRRHGVEVVERLKFAPNLFVVAIPAGQDPVEAAQRLAASGEVEFAEPELIEAISGR